MQTELSIKPTFSVNITYILKDGKKVHVKGKVGDNAMYLAHRHNIPLEGK